MGALNMLNTENTSTVSWWDGLAGTAVVLSSRTMRTWGDCRRVILNWRMKPPLAQGHTWEKWPVKRLSWFLDPSSAPRILNPSFPKECPNLQTKSRIRISLISSYCKLSVSRQIGKFMNILQLFALWEAAHFGKQEVLNPDVSKLHWKLTNSLEHEPGPKLSLPPQGLSQSVQQSDSCIFSVHLSLACCAPAHPGTVQLQGDGTETSWQNDYTQNWLWGCENRERPWSQPSNFWWSVLTTRLLWKWCFHNKK